MKESNYVHFFYRLDSSLSFFSGEREVYSGIHSVFNLKINEGVQ